MSKSIFISIVCLLLGVTLAGRFITVTTTSPRSQNKVVECTTANSTLLDADGFERIAVGPSCDSLDKINAAYLKDVRPIFKAKCFSCHGHVDHLPLYSKLPPASWLITHDMSEAKNKMDMTHDFPFKGHGSPTDDLGAIRKTIEAHKMPPFYYLIMHWESVLTEKGEMAILKWIQESQNILKEEEIK